MLSPRGCKSCLNQAGWYFSFSASATSLGLLQGIKQNWEGKTAAAAVTRVLHKVTWSVLRNRATAPGAAQLWRGAFFCLLHGHNLQREEGRQTGRCRDFLFILTLSQGLSVVPFLPLPCRGCFVFSLWKSHCPWIQNSSQGQGCDNRDRAEGLLGVCDWQWESFSISCPFHSFPQRQAPSSVLPSFPSWALSTRKCVRPLYWKRLKTAVVAGI